MARIVRSMALAGALMAATPALAQVRPPSQAWPTSIPDHTPTPTPQPMPDDTVPVVGDLGPTYVSPFGNERPTKGEADALDALQPFYDAWLSAFEDMEIAHACGNKQEYEAALKALRKVSDALDEAVREFVKDYSPTLYSPDNLKNLSSTNPEVLAVRVELQKRSKYKHRSLACPPKKEPRTVAPATNPHAAAAQKISLSTQIFSEINYARTEPLEFTRVLVDYRKNYSGKIMRNSSYPNGLITQEGIAAVDDAIGWTRMQMPRMPLMTSGMLTELAQSLVDEQGRTGATGHVSANGDGPGARMTKLGGGMFVSEALTYGPNAARDVALRLYIDDGQLDRGHRYMMMSPEFGYVGIACGPHPTRKEVCVVDYSSSYAAGAVLPRLSPPSPTPPPP